MSFGDAIQRRADLLHKRASHVGRIFRETAQGATLQAIRAAQDKTPPTAGSLAGTDTRSGQLKQHWGTDSETAPIVRATAGGVEYVTVLGNNQQYASYVDQGHRMDRHFVPGLTINPATGRLERVDPHSGPGGKLVGIVVGTKTSYVPGVFMAEAGRDAYEAAAIRALDTVVQEVFGNG